MIEAHAHAVVCANHPDRETSLHCNRCGKPICSKCAIQTPVGYRCPECVRGQQKVFDTASNLDYVISFVIAAITVGVAISLLRFIGFWGILLAPVIGTGIAELIRRAVGRRRSRRLPLAAALGGALGLLPYVLLLLFGLLSVIAGGGSISLLASLGFSVLFPFIYGALMLSTIYYRLGGIRL